MGLCAYQTIYHAENHGVERKTMKRKVQRDNIWIHGVERKGMKGICHKCFRTNIDVELIDGYIRCEDCRDEC